MDKRKETKTKIIIDTDPGIDDAIALILAARSEVLDIKLLSAVGGNNDVSTCFFNIIRVFKNAKLEMPPVAKGSNSKISFVKKIYVRLLHGFDGLNNTFLPFSKEVSNQIPVIKNNDEITVIALGPLTNIKEMVSKYSKQIKKIIVAGGIYDLVHRKIKFDFNIQSDREALFKILDSGVYIQFIPSNVYSKIYVSKREINKLSLYENQLHIKLILQLLKSKFLKFLDRKICLPDLIPVAAVIDPGLLEFKSGYFQKSKDRIINFCESKNGNIEIATGISISRFWCFFYKTMLDTKEKL